MAGPTQPDLTVVVIVYNDAERLPRAVHSVLAQTLNNLEVVIADDCSTDDTRQVAESLAASDPRVRYICLPENSGGCSGPRNAGIEATSTPYLMFLDSDDELPRHACKSLLLVAEETGADFVSGEVERYQVETKKSGMWYPHLFQEKVVYQGIQEKPEMLFDALSTNKIYRRGFIDRHALRFPEGIHYEDQLFSAKAFHLAKSFAVVPWVVYRWYLENDTANLSITSSRHKIQNLVDRLTVAGMIDDFMRDTVTEDAYPEAKAMKDYKFLRHDLRLYLGDLPDRDTSWLAEFADVVGPYLDTLSREAFERLPGDERICLHMLRERRLDDAVAVARTLGRAKFTPRYAVSADSRWFWGSTVPRDDAGRDDLDITDMYLDRQLFPTAYLRHEIHRLQIRDSVLRLHIRTYDPGHVLGEEAYPGTVNLAAHGSPLRAEFLLGREAPGLFSGVVDLDLAKVPMGVNGFSGRRHPTLSVLFDGHKNTSVLLAPLDLREHALAVAYRRLGTHEVTMRTEAASPRRLELTWRRTGVMLRASRFGPRQKAVKRRLKKIKKRVNSHDNKAAAYRLLSRLPLRRDLVLFEALEGKGYVDNPRYIHEELVRQGRRVRAVWSYSGDRGSFPAGTKLVRRGSWRYVSTMARAGYWVDSHNLPSIYTRRPGRHYLQTWHGQTMKTIGFDVPSLRNGTEATRSKHQNMVNRWTMLISPSSEFEKTFVPANRYTGALVRSGYPRNDVLVRWREPEQRERTVAARKRLLVPDDSKVLLYAPTFRDGARGGGKSIRVNLHELVEGLGEEWVVVVRAHYYDRFTVPTELRHAVRDGAGFQDVNDLLLASDALVTDYSSLMFDYANLGRPIVLYTDDYEQYKHSDRGTYYDLREIAPGPMIRTTPALVETLRSLDKVQATFADRYRRFQEQFCSYEDGSASKAVVDSFFGEAEQ